MRSTLRLGTIWGVPVYVHASCFALLVLVVLSVAQSGGAHAGQGWQAIAWWLEAGLLAAGAFAAILVHELGHAVVAARRGLQAMGVTLYLFGGVARLRRDPDRPVDELLIAAAGPAASIMLAGLATLLRLGFLAAALEPGARVTGFLVLLNTALAALNLLPGLPLDGGRVLRAVLWALTGSLSRSTLIAAAGGQAVAFLFLALGLFTLAVRQSLDGLWLVGVAWLISSAARTGYHHALVREALSNVPVRAIMSSDFAVIGPQQRLAEVYAGYVARFRGVENPDGRSAPVPPLELVPSGVTGPLGRPRYLHSGQVLPVVEDGRLVGTLRITRALRRGAGAADGVRVADVMERLVGQPLLSPDDPAQAALELVFGERPEGVPVVQQGRLAGLVTQASIARYLRAHRPVMQGIEQPGARPHPTALEPRARGEATPS